MNFVGDFQPLFLAWAVETKASDYQPSGYQVYSENFGNQSVEALVVNSDLSKFGKRQWSLSNPEEVQETYIGDLFT